MLTRFLVAHKEQTARERVEHAVRGEVESFAGVATLDEVWEALMRKDFDVLVMQRELLPESPRDFLRSLQSLPDPPGVIVLSEHEHPKERAELLSSGAIAVLSAGLPDTLLAEALVALASRHGNEVLERLGAERTEKRSTLDDFASSSAAMQRFLTIARRVVDGDSPLLILGETGVGKERLARSIHAESRRSAGPFITVHCGAIPETLLESELFGHEKGAFTGAIRARRGLFELAHRGTIFLDEIGEMPLHLQVKLLRALEDRRIRRLGGETATSVDVRILAATNRPLEREVEDGRFRADLYYRLAVVALTVPPLRERAEDVPALAKTFLERSRRKLGREPIDFSREALGALSRHTWPGNVRELMNVVDRAALLCSGREIEIADLRGDPLGTQAEAPPTPKRPQPTEAGAAGIKRFAQEREVLIRGFEADYLQRLLHETAGRIGRAARLAGLNERTLYGMMKRHRIQKEDFRPAPRDTSR